MATKLKNNHYVPRSYLRRFSVNGKQIALFNIKSGRVISAAPIKSQCSGDYFYSHNPKFEKHFSEVEGPQNILINTILETKILPPRGTPDHIHLLECIMLQAGRTQTEVDDMDHMADQYGRAMLRHQFEREGNHKMLAALDTVTIRTTNAVMEAVMNHLLMFPLIEDLDCTLLLNETSEDFLTSDHPIARCNSMPAHRQEDRTQGYASRGLIILYPLSPRVMLFLSDAEVYHTEPVGALQRLYKSRDIVELNLMQFTNAHENVYFLDSSRVTMTLEAFRKRSTTVRPPRPLVSKLDAPSPTGRKGKLFTIQTVPRRLSLPKPIRLRHAAKTKKFKIGDERVRDPIRTYLIHEKLKEVKDRHEPNDHDDEV